MFAVGIVEAKEFEAKHGHADAEDLPGTDVSMGDFSVANEVV